MKQRSRWWLLVILGITAATLLAGCATASGGGAGGGGSTGGSAAGASGDFPDWYLDPQSVYPDKTYLTSVGSGDSRRDAEQQALSGLSQTFEAQISVDSRTRERYRELMTSEGNMTETEIRLAETTNVQSNQTLLNVQFGEAAVDETGGFT